MIKGGKVEITVVFDSIFEATEWIKREYRGFKKTGLLAFDFNEPGDMSKALDVSPGSFVVQGRFFVPLHEIVVKRFSDTVHEIADQLEQYGGVLSEIEIKAVKYATTFEELDKLFSEVRNEIELWKFARAIDSLPKMKL